MVLVNKYIYIMLLISLIESCSINKQTFIVPKSYEGKVVVFYDKSIPKGKWEKDFRSVSYNIPNDGIIFTNLKTAEISELIWKNNLNEKINSDTIQERYKKNEIIVVNDVRSGYLFLNDNQIRYLSFDIGTKSVIDSLSKINNDDYLKIIYESAKK